MHSQYRALRALVAGLALALTAMPAPAAPFELVEARISDIQRALLAGDITTVELVEAYLSRIKAFNRRVRERAARESSDRSPPSRTPARSTH